MGNAAKKKNWLVVLGLKRQKNYPFFCTYNDIKKKTTMFKCLLMNMFLTAACLWVLEMNPWAFRSPFEI